MNQRPNTFYGGFYGGSRKNGAPPRKTRIFSVFHGLSVKPWASVKGGLLCRRRHQSAATCRSRSLQPTRGARRWGWMLGGGWSFVKAMQLFSGAAVLCLSPSQAERSREQRAERNREQRGAESRERRGAESREQRGAERREKGGAKSREEQRSSPTHATCSLCSSHFSIIIFHHEALRSLRCMLKVANPCC